MHKISPKFKRVPVDPTAILATSSFCGFQMDIQNKNPISRIGNRVL
jgi:hypothetical protein